MEKALNRFSCKFTEKAAGLQYTSADWYDELMISNYILNSTSIIYHIKLNFMTCTVSKYLKNEKYNILLVIFFVQVASSMVICTFLSAPIIFMSAQVISLNKDYAKQLKRFAFSLSIVALVATLWVILVFSITRKYKRMPHRLTLCLIVSQVTQ